MTEASSPCSGDTAADSLGSTDEQPRSQSEREIENAAVTVFSIRYRLGENIRADFGVIDGSNATQWIEWGARRELAIPQQDWTPFAADNAVFLADWTRHDGYVYAIYCGMRREGGGKGNGFNSIGIARSRDTLVWEVPGAVSA